MGIGSGGRNPYRKAGWITFFLWMNDTKIVESSAGKRQRRRGEKTPEKMVAKLKRWLPKTYGVRLLLV
ncbi:hypothetical protein AYX07_12245 [Thermoactinomyces sp. AS95]|nr:hypothetical protein JS81_13705 [Thermoactinomyces sp. Gus2-1]KYQ85892.1 hypothetical protein AYX07_12245 [Thermoactinomyces sp. AS95]